MAQESRVAMNFDLEIHDVVRVNRTGQVGLLMAYTLLREGQDLGEVLCDVWVRDWGKVKAFQRKDLSVYGNAFDVVPRSLADDPPKEGGYIALERFEPPHGAGARFQACASGDAAFGEFLQRVKGQATHWVPLPNWLPPVEEDRVFERDYEYYLAAQPQRFSPLKDVFRAGWEAAKKAGQA
jgi:hypothetical protein